MKLWLLVLAENFFLAIISETAETNLNVGDAGRFPIKSFASMVTKFGIKSAISYGVIFHMDLLLYRTQQNPF